MNGEIEIHSSRKRFQWSLDVTAGITTSGIQAEPIHFLRGGRKADLDESVSWENFTLFLNTPLSSKSIDVDDQGFYFCHVNMDPHSPSIYLLSSTTVEEGVWAFEDSEVSTLTSEELWDEAEPEYVVWRGLFYPPQTHKVLFSKRIEFHTADLPHWRPHLVLDQRTLERGNE